MSEFSLSTHAEFVIKERAIKREWLEKVVAAPDKTELDKDDPALKHALGRISEHEGRVLRVVYNDSVTPVRIVTAYFDRAMKGKL